MQLYNFYRNIDDYIPNLGMVSKLKLILYSAIDFILHGMAPSNYIAFEFWRKSYREKLTFLGGRRFILLQDKYNDKEKRNLFRDKRMFYKTFSSYMKRSWLDVGDCSFSDFKSFINNHDTVFIKPVYGSHGKGIRVLSTSDIREDELYEELKNEKVILEEKIRAGVLSEFNTSACTNSIRLITLLINGKTHLKYAVLRMAVGDIPVDNFSYGGLAAVVDVHTGIVITQGIDKKHKRYINHPYTGKQIIGYRIPMWDDIMNVVSEASKVVPEIRYVGWDVTINEDGDIVLIEGNNNSGAYILQEIDQIGKRYMFNV